MTRKKISNTGRAPLVALEAYTRATVPSELSHLVRLRASALNGCRYCTAMHRRDARKAGWSEARISTAEHWTHAGPGADEFDAEQKVVLRFTDAVTRIDGEESVPDDLWGELVRHRGETGATQLLLEVVAINAWNRVAVATRLDPATLR